MFRHKKALGQGLKCKVQLLTPGEQIEVSYSIHATGQEIMNEVVGQLDLLDRDYYGLKLHDRMQWLDLTKSVLKQTKSMGEVILLLRFKYYPAEPALMANESTRYFLYLQLRADLLDGKLKTDSRETIAYLIACILQSELGDASSSPETSSQSNYVSEYKFVPNQNLDLELASIELHRSEDFIGLSPADAELNFLKKTSQLDTYGIDPCPVKDGNSSKHFLIGVNHLGISTFQDSKRFYLFGWNEIDQINLDAKMVLIYCRRIEKKGTKTNKVRSWYVFRCPSSEHAQNFWKIATEHKYFFTLETTPDLPIVTNAGGLFRKSHKLRYVGRVEKDLLKDYVDVVRSSGVKRSRSLMSKTGDGPRWLDFERSNDRMQNSMNNIYSSDCINKTYPSNMNHFREDEEDYLNDEEGDRNASGGAGDFRPSIASSFRESPKSGSYNRKQVQATKSFKSSVRKGSQVYLETDQKSHDFIRASIFLLLILAATFLMILLINDSDRQNSVSFLVKKMNLERASIALRQGYYLPLKTALKQSFERLFSLLDSKLL